MATIDLNLYLTIEDAAKAVGCSRRALYRAIARIGREEVCVSVLGRSLVKKSAVAEIKKHYYPHTSAARKAMAKEWGAAGGRRKAANARKASKSRA